MRLILFVVIAVATCLTCGGNADAEPQRLLVDWLATVEAGDASIIAWVIITFGVAAGRAITPPSGRVDSP